MSFHRPAGRTATLLGTLLMTTAFAVPALAQIETVTVTAEKRVEDIQTVPIAVTAYNAEDIAAHQLTQFKDLQFSTPNVTYTKGNFTGSNFQIRGIGITAVGYDAESGVAVHEDDVPYGSCHGSLSFWPLGTGVRRCTSSTAADGPRYLEPDRITYS